MLYNAGSILCYSGAAFGPRTPPFFVDKLESFPQLTSNEVSDCTPNFWRICSHIFELGDLQLLGSSQFFTRHRGFPLITFLLGMLYCSFFQGLKDHRFLDVCAKFLFSDVYLSHLFTFNLGSSLGLSCLTSSMFVIILIIGIIKTTCFNNTILIADLKWKFP